MQIQFQTKEKSNTLQLESFLKLSKVERIYDFLNLMYKVNQFPTKIKTDKSANFLITIKAK
ncbi:hypothetical protein FNW52_05575 [Flavobacterium sp. ZT3R18]|uniref:hypothetical protein n=1 Tax=Flavobacterium sp. ZT3R18 TaxID=2594429 RepID=UPI00117B1589|nr:hypothetical protein [Flavobacterium sp. ZT3R18]TRX37431.1 hypothetical protein FNW52_05575 [Flavobacterium sp. ZT3R18]